MIELLGGKAALIGAFAIGCLVWLGTMFKMAFNAGKHSQEAKEGKANAKTIDDIAKARAAASRANDGKLFDDDGFKRD